MLVGLVVTEGDTLGIQMVVEEVDGREVSGIWEEFVKVVREATAGVKTSDPCICPVASAEVVTEEVFIDEEKQECPLWQLVLWNHLTHRTQ